MIILTRLIFARINFSRVLIFADFKPIRENLSTRNVWTWSVRENKSTRNFWGKWYKPVIFAKTYIIKIHNKSMIHFQSESIIFEKYYFIGIKFRDFAKIREILSLAKCLKLSNSRNVWNCLIRDILSSRNVWNCLTREILLRLACNIFFCTSFHWSHLRISTN